MTARTHVMKPWLGEEEVRALAEVIESGWVAQGPRVAAFERAFADRMKAPHAVATSSCTAALHLALVVAGIDGGDVVVPSFSFVATANAPRYVGARTVFADVNGETGNLTAASVVAALTPQTRAVIAVDQGGMPVDLASIRQVCDPRGIRVIEDAACGAGSTYRDRPVGAGADLTAWSFHPRKVLTTGEGGMLTTGRSEWAERARALREHATTASAAARHQELVAAPEAYPEVGFNYRMTDLQAAVGLVQLSRLAAMVTRRRHLAERYRGLLGDIPGLRLVADPEWGTCNFQSLWLEVAEPYPLDRDEVLHLLAAHGVSARRGIMAAHRHDAHRDAPRGELPTTEHLTDSTLILPLYHELAPVEIDRIATIIQDAA